MNKINYDVAEDNIVLFPALSLGLGEMCWLSG